LIDSVNKPLVDSAVDAAPTPAPKAEPEPDDGHYVDEGDYIATADMVHKDKGDDPLAEPDETDGKVR
jgi:hypothetical protein